MRRLRIGVIDLVARAPTRALWARLMHANMASIMPQAVAVWCEELGHDVTFVCYTGLEDLAVELPDEIDVLFIGAFTQAGQLAYAISNLFRDRGAVTVLGGPHARCYPDDARKYFDYVVGFTDRAVIQEILDDVQPQREYGEHLSADKQPTHLPGVRERWKFIEPTIAKSPGKLKGIPMIASLGCPYTCSFCIDSVVRYQPVEGDRLRDDLRFLVERLPNAWVGWHDPNFGVRFDEHLSAIEAGVNRGNGGNGGNGGNISFAAESSLSLLSESNLKRLRDNQFKVMLPGIESWFSLGNKSKTRNRHGLEKVKKVSEHVNMLLDHIPYVQTNFVLGLDVDEGPEPFELTKRFLDMTPGAFPGYSLLTAFGEAAPLNLEFQRDGRVLPFPFHFLNNNQAMNVRPKNYEWPEFYDLVIDLTRYSFSWKAIARRAKATPAIFARVMNFVRAISTEGFGRIKYYETVREKLDTDREFRRFFDGETTRIPTFFTDRIKRELGPFWEYLPPGAIEHDPNAYLKKHNAMQQADSPRMPEAKTAGGGAS